MRENEIEGEDYYFVNYKTYANKLSKNELVFNVRFAGKFYGLELKRIDRLNLFHFEEKISEEQSKNYQQSRTNSKSSLTVAESEFESIFSFSDL